MVHFLLDYLFQRFWIYFNATQQLCFVKLVVQFVVKSSVEQSMQNILYLKSKNLSILSGNSLVIVILDNRANLK
jgi:hypothetical protein